MRWRARFRRRAPARVVPFEHFRMFAFGSDEELIGTFGSLEAAAAAWERVKDRFLEGWNLWGRPQAWWRFEPAVPDELRKGPALVLSDADGDAWRTLEDRRREYLRSLGIEPTTGPIRRPFGR